MSTVLVLRCNAPNMSSHGGFVWPGVGKKAVAPDWNPAPKCGAGLHGWLHGQGDVTSSRYCHDKGAKWLVVEVEAKSIVLLDGKCKFPEGIVRFVGTMPDAAAYIIAHSAEAKAGAVIGAVVTVGDNATCNVGALGTATAGYDGTATAGYDGTAIVGDCGTATAGNRGTATAGYRGTATAGYVGTATAGYRGTAIAGDCGKATAGNWGTATAGYDGTATAGDYGKATVGAGGTAIAGDGGTATAGGWGTATAGDGGLLMLRWYDGTYMRNRIVIAYVGKNGIMPNTAYRLSQDHEVVKA